MVGVFCVFYSNTAGYYGLLNEKVTIKTVRTGKTTFYFPNYMLSE